MNKIEQILFSYGQEKNGWEGPDACLEISLFEYGVIWKRTEQGIIFIYLISEEKGKVATNWVVIPLNKKVEELYRWIFNHDKLENERDTTEMVESFISYMGEDLDQWKSGSLEYQIYDLTCYFGKENIFGDCYYPMITCIKSE